MIVSSVGESTFADAKFLMSAAPCRSLSVSKRSIVNLRSLAVSLVPSLQANSSLSTTLTVFPSLPTVALFAAIGSKEPSVSARNSGGYIWFMTQRSVTLTLFRGAKSDTSEVVPMIRVLSADFPLDPPASPPHAVKDNAAASAIAPNLKAACGLKEGFISTFQKLMSKSENMGKVALECACSARRAVFGYSKGNDVTSLF